MDEIVRDVNDGWDDVDPGRSKAMQSVLAGTCGNEYADI